MKIIGLFLVALIAGAYGDRIVIAGEDIIFRTFAYIATLKYPPGQVPAGKENSLLAAVMGKALPGALVAPPYISVIFAQGKENVTTSGDQFQGSVTGLIWAYDALGEYCEQNGVQAFNGVVTL
jgi:hypothetical protein